MRQLLGLSLLLALAACASPEPTYYTLQAALGTQLAGSVSTIELRRPGLAGYLDRSSIVLKNAAYKLDVNGQLLWAEPLGDMIGRVLTQDLSQRLPGASVFAQSGAITADPQLRVEVDIATFDADATGAIVLNAEVAILRGATHTPLSTRHVSLSAPAAGAGAAAVVAGMSALLGRLAEGIAADIARAPAPGLALGSGKEGLLFREKEAKSF